MIDPQEAAGILTHAGCTLVQLDGQSFYLMGATARQLESIKNSRARHPSIAAARKALRLGQLLTELKQDLDGLPHCSKPGAAAEEKDSHKSKPKVDDGDPTKLALVPYVKTVPLDEAAEYDDDLKKKKPPAAAARALRNAAAFFAPYARLYGACLRLVVTALAYAPLITLYVGVLYFGFGLLYLLMHPALLVKAMFSLLDVVPNYANYAAESMWQQMKTELALRFSLG